MRWTPKTTSININHKMALRKINIFEYEIDFHSQSFSQVSTTKPFENCN